MRRASIVVVLIALLTSTAAARSEPSYDDSEVKVSGGVFCYVADFNRIRDRARDLGTTGIVSEFGHPVAGFTSDKTPSVLKAMYQSLDSRVSGANWWSQAARSGPALSGSQWHWDVYYGRHHELLTSSPA